MTCIFISHSKKDTDLVLSIKKLLENIGQTPIIQEFIPKVDQEIPHKEIRDNVNKSKYLFLFLTDNVVETEYTKNWIMFEVGVAASISNKIFVFEREGIPISYPIPHVTDYALFNPDDTQDMLKIQELAKRIGSTNKKPIAGAVAGAVIGSILGPVGTILGGILGGVGAYATESDSPKDFKVKCHHCEESFNYHFQKYKDFNCPCCRKSIQLE